jgi:hypothetical protein
MHMYKIIITINIILSLFYIMQINLLIQNAQANDNLSKTAQRNNLLDKEYLVYNAPISNQFKIFIINSKLQKPMSDIYIPPEAISKALPLNQPLQPLQPPNNSTNTVTNPNTIQQHFSQINKKSDIYIPPEAISKALPLNQPLQPLQPPNNSTNTVTNPSLSLDFNLIAQNISSSLYSQINSDIDDSKFLFNALYNICNKPIIHLLCKVDINNLQPNYNFETIKNISNIAKDNLEIYQKNPTIIGEQRFKQSNLDLSSCLFNMKDKSQTQLHDLLGSQLVDVAQTTVNTLRLKDIIQVIALDWAKVEAINEQLGIKPDPLLNKCF